MHMSNNMKSKIRDTVLQLNRFLDMKISSNSNDKKSLDLYRSTKKFCYDNPDIIFIKVDKKNVMVMCLKIRTIYSLIDR